LSEIDPATERLSERERTLILAILATLFQMSGLVFNSMRTPLPGEPLSRRLSTWRA